MRKFLITLSILFSINTLSLACDVCGCALGAMSLDVLPESNTHFVGLRYMHASFNAKITYNSIYVDDVFSNDNYSRMEIFGRYYFTKRFSATAILPYVVNNMNGNTQNVSVNGVGDPTVLTSYMLIKAKEKQRWKQNLILGAGATFPIGENEFRDGEELVNRNFQPGKGSLSAIFNLNYLIRKKNVGLNTEVSYMINSRNQDNYRFGNQFNATTNLFYLLKKAKFAFMPLLGVYVEQAQEHLEGKFRVINSGGNALFSSIGFQLYFNKFILNGNVLAPAIQNYNTDNLTSIESNWRYTVGLRYNFEKN